MLLLLISLFARANEDCTLDSVRFQDVSTSQSTVLQRYGAICKDVVNPETQAQAIYKKATTAIDNGEQKVAKEYLSRLENDFNSTQVWQNASKTQRELDTLGMSISKYNNVEWIQGYNDIHSNTVLLVFWEVWCPKCTQELPKLQRIHDTYHHQGLTVVGLTKMSRSSTPEKISTFIRRNSISYPLAKEYGQMSDMFAVSELPAAALLHNGRVVWRGHPAKVNKTLLAPYLQ